MIVPIGKYFLYRHIRTDNGKPFYIGIGTKRNSNPYVRAFNKFKKPSYWYNIVNKNNGEYEIEIILESDSYEFIEQKEIEFISLYGRKNNSTGILTNETDGGKGSKGVKQERKTIENRVSKIKGVKRPNYVKDKISKSNKGKISCPECIEKLKKKILEYDLEGYFVKEWPSLTLAAKSLGTSTTTLSKCLKGNLKYVKRSQWRYKLHENYDLKIEKCEGKLRPIFQYSLNGEFISRWESGSDIANYYKISKEKIYDVCKSKHKKFNNFIWLYELKIPNNLQIVSDKIREYYS